MLSMLLTTMGIPLAITVCLMPFARKVATRSGLIDRPSARKLHANPTPLLGGLAVYAAIVIYEASKGAIAGKVMAIVAACGVAVVLGALDDFYDIHSRYRLCIQACLALLLGVAGFRTGLLPYGFDLALSVVWITGMINAMNCFDCADGVCGGVSVVILFCYGAMLTMAGHADLARISFVSAGAVCGFLFFNFPPAKIFMGDCGSTALGMLIGAISLRAMADSAPEFVLYAAAPVALPVCDIVIVHMRRYAGGIKNIRDLLASSGKDHLPHRMIDIGLSPRQTAVSLYIGTAVLAAVPVAVRLRPTLAPVILAAAILLGACVEWMYMRSIKRPQAAVVATREEIGTLSVPVSLPGTRDA